MNRQTSPSPQKNNNNNKQTNSEARKKPPPLPPPPPPPLCIGDYLLILPRHLETLAIPFFHPLSFNARPEAHVSHVFFVYTGGAGHCPDLRPTRRQSTELSPNQADIKSGTLALGNCSLQSLDDRLVGRTWGTIQQRSSSSLFVQEALDSSSGMSRDVHSLMLSIQHLFCRLRRGPPSKVSRMMFLERLSWRVTCPNHASFHLCTVARRGFCGPTRKLILLCTQSSVLCSKEMRGNFPQTLLMVTTTTKKKESNNGTSNITIVTLNLLLFFLFLNTGVVIVISWLFPNVCNDNTVSSVVVCRTKFPTICKTRQFILRQPTAPKTNSDAINMFQLRYLGKVMLIHFRKVTVSRCLPETVWEILRCNLKTDLQCVFWNWQRNDHFIRFCKRKL